MLFVNIFNPNIECHNGHLKLDKCFLLIEVNVPCENHDRVIDFHCANLDRVTMSLNVVYQLPYILKTVLYLKFLFEIKTKLLTQGLDSYNILYIVII